MSVHYLIDGYNLIYAFREIPTGTWQQKREYLLTYLQQKKPQGNNPVTVVFDSREGMGDRSQVGSITVVFTSGETADEHLSALVRKMPNPRSLRVVSNDRGLQTLVRGTGARSLASTEFLKQGMSTGSQASDRPADPPANSQDITDELKKKWL